MTICIDLKCVYFHQVPVAHAYNPSHSGDRDQENLSSRPAQTNSLRDPISQKKGCRSGSGEGPEFEPHY
jgi:hypothetical protein